MVDWRTYSAVVVELVADRPRSMRFNVRHAGSSAYPTVIDEEFNVKQGKNVIRLPISSLKNTNGSNLAWIKSFAGTFLSTEKTHLP